MYYIHYTYKIQNKSSEVMGNLKLMDFFFASTENPIFVNFDMKVFFFIFKISFNMNQLWYIL